ncbi:hypothetical protein BDW42DRAFT_188218 [Aspergillus taichungensis]|uniref:Uncharacterized protein n=1 Tax=Aspergillus taichungensis TaxID=482145 RepID=A0A2J5HJB7_9EURO|nr:hypothetical protein BDW42DRAFT_188218 [Aspergillus taichungensis]
MEWVAGIFFFGVVVLGLSVTLLLGQHWLSPPAATKYAIFTGAFGMLAALVGAAALYLDRLPGFVIWAVDGLARRQAFAAILGGANCFNARETSTNQLLSGGCWDFEGRKGCWHMANFDTDALEMRCMSAKADSIFMATGALVTPRRICKRFRVDWIMYVE